MKYRDLNINIFADVFATRYPNEFAEIFGSTSPEKVDAYAKFHYGERTLLASITSTTMAVIADAIIYLNVGQWQRGARAIRYKYDFNAPVLQERTRKETATENAITTDVSTDSNKAFNDTDFTPDSKGQTDGTRNNDRTATVTETTKGVASMADAVAAEMELAKKQWADTVVGLLIGQITNSIY